MHHVTFIFILQNCKKTNETSENSQKIRMQMYNVDLPHAVYDKVKEIYLKPKSSLKCIWLF